MSKKRCSRCGRIYSSSYRSCPYCSGRSNGRRTQPDTLMDRLGGILEFLHQHRERIFLVSTAIFLAIAALGMILTRCASKDPKPADDDAVKKPEAQEPAPAPLPDPLALSRSAVSIFVGETAQLTASGGAGTFVWTTSDEAVASVSSGTITANGAGTATITVSCGTETASCAVTVTEKEPEVEVYLNRTDFTLPANDPPFQMKVKVKDTRQDYDGTVVWSSGDTSIVTISESGLVERVGRGTTTVTATVGGKTLECIVRVP